MKIMVEGKIAIGKGEFVITLENLTLDELITFINAIAEFQTK